MRGKPLSWPSLPANYSHTVSVGNIPYEQTEEQLIEVFSEVGPVVSFRYAGSSRMDIVFVELVLSMDVHGVP